LLYNYFMSIENIFNERGLEKLELNETEKESLIKESNTFDQLYVALDEIGIISGNEEDYTPSQLIDKIERVRNNKLDLNYITRRYGLRETVQRLLKEPSPNTEPDQPPPHEASIALEPKPTEAHSDTDINEVSPLPENPPELTSSVKLNLPNEGDSVILEKTESDPEGPISPLTEIERDFYYRAAAEETIKRNSGVLYEASLRAAPGKYLDINKPEVEERYRMLQKKIKRYEKITNPNSFKELAATLQNADFQENGEILEGAEIWTLIERIRNGEEVLDVLPASMREGLASLIAREIYEHIITSGKLEISAQDWEIFVRALPADTDYLGRRIAVGGYPRIGDENVRLKNGTHEGRLVWANRENVIFRTTEGFEVVSADEVLMDDGTTRSENEGKKQGWKAEQKNNQKLRERQLPKDEW
jgi:hypothetical protein